MSLKHPHLFFKRSLLLISGAFFIGSIAGCSQKNDAIQLGFAAPLTGNQAHYGAEVKNGALLAIEEFNATQPKIDGKVVKFALQAEDDQADPRQATLVAQRLVDNGVKGVLGHFNSGASIPASRIYAKANLPQISLSSAPEYTLQGFKTTFRVMPTDIQQGTVLGTLAVKKLGFKNIVVVDDRTAYGLGLADEFAKTVLAKGAKITDREYATDKTVDFRAILTNIKRRKADAIFYGGTDAQAAPLVQQMRELGMKIPLIGGEMVKTDTFLKMAGKAAEGSFATLLGLPLDKMPQGKTFVARYTQRFGAAPSTSYAPYSYDSAKLMMTAMVKANSSDPAKYLPVLAKIALPGVTTPELSFDERGDLKHAAISVYKVVKGQWKVLTTLQGN